MAVNTWDGASDTNWNDAANWNTTGVTDRVPTSADDVVIANVSNDPTMPDGLNPTIKSLEIETGGQLTAGNNNISIEGVNSNGLAFYVSGTGAFVKGTSTITFTDSSNQYISINTSNANRTFYNVTVNKTGSGDVYIYQSRDGSSTEPLVISNNLTISARGFNTANDSSSPSAYFDLTVSGQVTGAGTLTGNTSAILMGYFGMTGTYNATSGTTTINSRNGSGYRMSCGVGDIVHNNGTFKFDTTGGGNSNFILTGTSDGTNGIYDLEIDTGNTVTIENNALSIHRNLTITSGTLNTNGSSNYGLTVTGDVSLANNTTLTCNASTCSFGSIDIGSSGATLNGSSGTTTITGEKSDYAWTNARGDNGYVHNNGKVVIETAGDTQIKENKFYDFELNLNSATTELSWRDISGNAMAIYGDLTITRGRLQSVTSGDSIDVYGNTYIAVTHGTLWHDADQDTNKITHHGLVTNHGTFKINDGTTVKLNGGIRQLGTLTIA